MVIDTGVEDRQWYVVHTHPKQERAYSNLVAWGVETLNPKLKTRRVSKSTGAPTYITEPLFPRYIFAKFNVRTELSKILFTRGVHNVVRFGDSPACVNEEIIDLIRARMDQNGFVRVSNDPKRKERAVISAGPLRKLMEIFEREVEGSERNFLLLTAIESQGPSGG